MTSRRILEAVIGLVSLCLAGCATNQAVQDKARAHLTVGTAYIKSEMYTEALRELFAAEKLDPRNPVIHYHLGIAYLGRDARDHAMDSFRRAVNLNPDYSEAHNYIGVILLEQGQWDQAIAAFDRALANILYDTPAGSLFNKGWALYRKGAYEASLECYQDAVRKRDAYTLLPLLQRSMGLSSLALGRIDDAAFYFGEALKMVPHYIEAKYWLAVTLVQKRQYGEARELFLEVSRDETPRSEFAPRAKEMLEKMNKRQYGEIRWQP